MSESEKNALLDALVQVSRRYGSDPAFVLAGGGNTSVKDQSRMWVKASGRSLATARPEDFVEMDLGRIHALLEQEPPGDPNAREALYKQSILAARSDPGATLRPSVECALHAILNCHFVVHTHATAINAITCSNEGESLARSLYGERIVWIPYVDPGWTLTREVLARLKHYREATGRETPEAILLQNHGLIVCGDTPEEIESRTDNLLNSAYTRLRQSRVEQPFGTLKQIAKTDGFALVETLAPALRGLLAEDDALPIVHFDDGSDAIALTCGEAGQAAALGGPLTPDQIVYCGSWPLWLSLDPQAEKSNILQTLRSALADYRQKHTVLPNVVLVQGLGMFTRGPDIKSALTVRDVYLDAIRVMAGAKQLGGIHYLTDAQREFIESWEVEAYRRKVAAGAASGGKVQNKVAVVTGAAQGFGLEIAEDLLKQGAHVALTDLNHDEVTRQSTRLEKIHGAGRVRGLGTNVCESNSIQEALHTVVRQYGGVDLLVSNAGILLAESVKTQPPKDFAAVTKVNYHGYFLCVQNVAPILALQHELNPDSWSDIIQINSKSGLVGSNRNAAYAGGKFGGIGLTQSFALELVEDGIKVNSICPGNFFDGPLWSDPENGLFVQYLRTGKVPAAKTIEDVRRAYEDKVPMRRGCTTADVMKAIYYLIEQRYETGQAVPVTGGQVMLH